ncbi:hypothetical protein F5878DRAFT_407833 [Lentinula raphanica]|uniref:F-box domain-containing protein n=1 Tax=Lentinula raphanica TaxID=153919 RepID=A0AA38PGM5_9AGAR|nr:hypothetical protein F5878DRAFT_407833 [Lentinula raphanica]
MINMPFSLLDRFRSRLQRNKNWKLSNKVHKYQTPVQRSSQESDDSEFTQVTKTSFDTVASLASISTISTSVSTHSIPIPSATDINALQTNDLPSSKEVTEIHTVLDAKRRKTFELERRKEVLDRQRKFLDRQLHLLDEELGEMTEDVVKYKGVVGCSMRNIPSDLLLEIFQHYVAESDCTSSLGSATTLTHVCRTWRQIALSCPALWITLTASHINERVATNVLERLNQVRAATGIPLAWYIDLRRMTEVEDETFQRVSSELVHASVDQVQRWKSFSLHCEDELFTSGAHEDLFPAISNAPMLESLDFAFSPQNEEWSPTHWVLSIARAAPALRNIQLKLPSLLVRDLSTLHLSHLESLTIDLPTITPAALLLILGNVAPSLKACHVRIDGLVNLDSDEVDDDAGFSPIVVHSCLEVFELRLSRGASPETLSYLFDHLECPRMCDVTLEVGQFESAESHSLSLPDDLELSWPHDSFNGFLERASSCVTSLCLGFNPSSPESADNAWGGMGSLGSELESEHVQAYLDLKNIGESLVTLHVRRDKPVWPELLEYLTLSVPAGSPSTCSFSSGSLENFNAQPLRRLEDIALDIDPIFQVLPMRDLVRSRWNDNPVYSSSSSAARLRSFAVTLCFPDIPNLELDSAAARKVFERITQGDDSNGKLDVSFHRRTYAMMPMDVPLVPLGSELTV